MNKRFCGSAVEQCLLHNSFLQCLNSNWSLYCMVPRYIDRHRITGLSESYDTQASAKSCSSSFMRRINSSFSSSVIPLILVAMLVTNLRSLSSVSMVDQSSTILLNALFTRGHCFLCGQFQAICPCSEHSKHCPSCRYFCFSASVVAFRIALTSIAFGSKVGALRGF